MFKLGHCVDGDWVEYVHETTYRVRESGDKLTAAVPHGDPAVFRALAADLTPPCMLLYVLHTPRGEAEAGRYQSGGLSSAELDGILSRFTDFLGKDGRFDLWVHSPTTSASIVWDRHDLIHAYGPAERFAEILRSLGFRPGDPVVPAPHEHHYHRELDPAARAFLEETEWFYSPLRPEDVQRMEG